MTEVPVDMATLITAVDQQFPVFGANKRQEITRLVFEIARKEGSSIEHVLRQIPAGCKAYPALKSYLVSRRFPEAFARGEKISEVFAALSMDAAHPMPLQRASRIPSPRRVFMEKSVKDSDLAARVQRAFPQAAMQVIQSYKEYCSGISVDIPMYNRRTEDLFIVRESHDHFKPCPCSPGVVPCGYHNVNLGFGCPFECSYCFLQNYTNAPGIVIPANIDDFFEAFKQYKPHVRVGSGETTDSLVYDDLTGFAARIVDFFRAYPQSTFEFKTKSDNIQGLLSVKAASNIVAGWSLNPQDVIDKEEHFTASLEDRLDAARRCAAHGYRVAFHFDPVIYSHGWEGAYADVIARMFKAVPAASIAWISVGTLRMTRTQKKTIENRFPGNTILDAELLTDLDGKLRYAQALRLDIYSKMMAWLDEKADASTFIYLCMEMESVWKIIQGQRPVKKNCLILRNGLGYSSCS